MSIIGFITQHWETIATVGGVVGGWLAKRSIDWAALRKRALSFARAAYPEILTYADAHARARRLLEDAVWAGVGRLGVRKSKRLDLLVDQVIDEALAELAGHLIVRDLKRVAAPLERAAAKLETAR